MDTIDALNLLFLVLVWLKVKHFLADYPLQTPYQLGKFKPGWDFVPPLLLHCSIHGAFTLLLCLWFSPALWWLALADMASHFLMDRVKAGPKYLGRFKPLTSDEFKRALDTKNNATDAEAVDKANIKLKHNTYFWWSLGFDQMWHGISDLAVLYAIFALTL